MYEHYGNNDWRDYCNQTQLVPDDQNEFEHSDFYEEYYSENDWREFLEHAWGTSPKMKAAEKKYNAEYWEKHKERIMARRRKFKLGLSTANKIAMNKLRTSSKKSESKDSGNENLESLRERRKQRETKAERMAEYKKNYSAASDDEEGGSGKKKKGSGSSKKSEAEKAAEKAKKEAEKAAKKKQREEEKAKKEAERAANKKKREEEKAVRDAERAANKKKREEEKAVRDAERAEKKRQSDAEKAAKEREKEISKRNEESMDKLVDKYYGQSDDGEGTATPVNNLKAFAKALKASGHSASSESEIKKLWKEFKKRVEDDSEVNEKGFVDKEVQSSVLKKFKRERDNSEDGKVASMENWETFKASLEKSGHSEISDEVAKKLWKSFRKQLS